MANRGKKDTYQVQIEINTEEEWNDLCSKVVITNLIKQNILICIKEIILEFLVAFDILLRLMYKLCKCISKLQVRKLMCTNLTTECHVLNNIRILLYS